MFLVTVRSALTLEFLWCKCITGEDAAESYAGVHFDPENTKGGGFLTATWEKV